MCVAVLPDFSHEKTSTSVCNLTSYIALLCSNSSSSNGRHHPCSTKSSNSVSGARTEIWYIHNIAANQTGVTIDTDNEITMVLNASEWSGLNNAVPEATNTNTATASTTVTTNSVTPSSAANLIIGMGGWTANDYSSGPTNSFNRMTQTGVGAIFQESGYLIQSSATANSTGWTLTAGINWAASIAAFGGPTTGPTPSQRSAGFFMNNGK